MRPGVSVHRATWLALAVVALPIATISCERVGGVAPNPTATPTTTASPTATPSPSACATPDSNNPNLVVVGIASGFNAVAAPPYGNIGGYAVIDPTGASPAPPTAGLITATIGGNKITTQNTIQFTNLEQPGSPVLHSAVGFVGGSFPAKPFAFPSPEASPTASAVSTSKPWSTGLIASPVSTLCYSQEFTLQTGTYYFGDFSYYNLTTFQDVLIVSP
jgi:hypothetical protein